jgi:hypothetical protein
MRTQADKKANTGDVLAAAPDRVTMSSDLLQLLYPNLLYRRLPDLIGHPGRSVLWLLDLSSVALIDMDLFCAPFPQPYILDSSARHFEGCLPGCHSRIDANLIARSISEGEIPLFFQNIPPTQESMK